MSHSPENCPKKANHISDEDKRNLQKPEKARRIMNVQNYFENQIDAEKRFFCHLCERYGFANRRSLLNHYQTKKHLKNVAEANN